jgi:hypothetical protein
VALMVDKKEQSTEPVSPTSDPPRRPEKAHLLRGEDLGLAILDALSAQIAVLDQAGGIVTVNESWQRFARENGNESSWPIPATSVGINYLAVCQSSAAPDSTSALQAHDGIKAVLSGRTPSFTLEYTCHAGQQQRWFRMSVTPLEGGAVVAHTDFTEFKQAEEAVRKQKEFFHLIAEKLATLSPSSILTDGVSTTVLPMPSFLAPSVICAARIPSPNFTRTTGSASSRFSATPCAPASAARFTIACCWPMARCAKWNRPAT